MNKIELKRSLGNAVLKLQKFSPEIMVGAGITGVVIGIVMACKATTKAPEILEKADEKRKNIKETESICELLDDDEKIEAEKEVKRDLTRLYLGTAWEFIKLYGPAAIVEGLSIGSIVCSTGMYRKRLAASAAAYLTLDNSFKAYRGRVLNRFGEEVENEIRNDIHKEKIEETVTDENGKNKKVKKEIEVANANVVKDFTFYFDRESSKAWDPDEDYNDALLRAEQSYANDILKARGHIFLNEVLDRLGIERTKAGQIVGWVYKKDSGDNYVDFRARKVYIKTPDGELTQKIILDFNVDGNVLDLI